MNLQVYHKQFTFPFKNTNRTFNCLYIDTSTNMYAYEYSLQSNIVFASLYTTIKIFKGGNGIHSLDTLVMCINLYKQVVHLSYILHITTKLNNFFN